MQRINTIYEQPFIIEKNETVIQVSRSFVKMMEYKDSELLNSNIIDLFKTLKVGPNVDINIINEQTEYFLFTKSFEVKLVNIQIIHSVEGKVYVFLEKADLNLEFSFPFANMLYSGNYYGIGIYSAPDKTLLKANEKYISFFDKPYNKKENCIGKNVSEVTTGFKGSTYEEIWSTVLKTGEQYNIDEYMYEGFNKGITYWRLSLVPICEENKIKYCIEMLIDITDQVLHRKKAEEQTKIIKEQQNLLLKREIEKNEMLERAIEMKDEFLSLISHEFRTPLNVINSAIQAMNYMCGNELSGKSKRYLDMIKQNTFRQLRLVNNLLDITRADAGCIKINKKNRDIVFLTKAIIESVHIYASQKEVSVAFVSSLRKKIVGIDDEKYERILLNLLSNAIKFTPKGKAIVVSLYSKKGSIYIEVKDNGIGIPRDKIDIIFERFGQVDSSLSRQAEGTGIGLSLIKKFVEALGGSISVKSKVGKGSIFTVVMPNETVVEEHNEKGMIDLLGNRLIQTTSVEFSDIYL